MFLFLSSFKLFHQIKIFKLLILILTCFTSVAQKSDLQDLFKNHKDGYNVFRIPTVIVEKINKVELKSI